MQTTEPGRRGSFEASRIAAVLGTLPGATLRNTELAQESFTLLKSDQRHPSLHLKRLGKLWSVRVGDYYRALGTDMPEGVLWMWIGTHADYDRITG